MTNPNSIDLTEPQFKVRQRPLRLEDWMLSLTDHIAGMLGLNTNEYVKRAIAYQNIYELSDRNLISVQSDVPSDKAIYEYWKQYIKGDATIVNDTESESD